MSKSKKESSKETILPSFISIAAPYRTDYIIEKSHFITSVCPCQTEEEAQAFINCINKEFWDASHNCTAYALGPRQEQQRSSDNGEPSGTAGKPILEVLKKKEITNTAIVVTRYFGGIKLGAGGLIRAYSHAATLGLDGAQKELHAPRKIVMLTIDYSLYNPLEQYLQQKDIYFTKAFEAAVTLTLQIPPDQLENIHQEIINLTNNHLDWQEGNTLFATIPLNA
ncbi:MAG: YigZ family protein [Veillonellaceae bacterium]|nr:YigZ family protein [Veillonellaceae bacterium]